MTLKIEKEPNKSKTDYNVIVKYDEKTLEVFRMSWLVEKMLREPNAYPEVVYKILMANGITHLSIEEVEQKLLK